MRRRARACGEVGGVWARLGGEVGAGISRWGGRAAGRPWAEKIGGTRDPARRLQGRRGAPGGLGAAIDSDSDSDARPVPERGLGTCHAA